MSARVMHYALGLLTATVLVNVFALWTVPAARVPALVIVAAVVLLSYTAGRLAERARARNEALAVVKRHGLAAELHRRQRQGEAFAATSSDGGAKR